MFIRSNRMVVKMVKVVIWIAGRVRMVTLVVRMGGMVVIGFVMMIVRRVKLTASTVFFKLLVLCLRRVIQSKSIFIYDVN